MCILLFPKSAHFFPLKKHNKRIHACVFPDLDACLNVECPSFAVCVLFIYLFICLFTFLITDLDPCLNVECPSFGVCRTYSAHESRCVCFQDCPSYQDPVCTANGTTYDNKCWHELSYCRGLENNLVYHPGSCEGNDARLLIRALNSRYSLTLSNTNSSIMISPNNIHTD